MSSPPARPPAPAPGAAPRTGAALTVPGGPRWWEGAASSPLSCPLCAPVRSYDDMDVLFFPEGEEIPIKLCQSVFGWANNFKEDYLAGDPLGRGSYGVVRKAVEKATGRVVAVKSISKSRPVWTGGMDGGVRDATTSTHLLKVQAEVNTLARMSDVDEVLALEKVYEDDSRVYLVMELCEGGCLQDVLQRGQSLGEERGKRLARSVLAMLSACHSRGIIYRDIKPANFLFLTDGEDSPVKCIDFGLAANFIPGAQEYMEKRAGTPVYMAPEVVMQKYDEKADMWSAGVMIYHALSGRVPFWGGEVPVNVPLKDIFFDVMIKDLRLDGAEWEGISEEAKAFLRALLQRDPDNRLSALDALRHPWLAAAN